MRKFALESRYSWSESRIHKFALEHTLTIPGGVTYTYIPKNACTAVRFAAARANGFVNESGLFPDAQSLIKVSLQQAQNAEYTFTLLREPYMRLASMFLDKACREPRRFRTLQAGVTRRLKLGIDQWTFRKFVERLARPGALMKEHHWAPQCAFMLYENYDDYFAVEHADAAFATLSDRLEIANTRRASGHTTEGKKRIDGHFMDTPVKDLRAMLKRNEVPTYDSLYDANLRERVYSLYEDDFNLYDKKISRPSIV